MRKEILAIVASCKVRLFPQQSQLYYLPQLIDGSTSSGTIRTTLMLTNLDTANAAIQVCFTGANGSPRQLNLPTFGSGSRFSLSLKPGGSKILQTDGSGDESAGAATVSSTAALGVSTIVSAYDSSGNLLSEASASSSDLYSDCVVPIDTTGGLNPKRIRIVRTARFSLPLALQIPQASPVGSTEGLCRRSVAGLGPHQPQSRT
jgi:hypothetical protein